jgi:hypothetical protein
MVENKNMKNRVKKNNKSLIIIFLIVLIALFVFLLFPRKIYLKDGGTVLYQSVGLGYIYQVEQRHRIYTEGNYSYYEIGTRVMIFRMDIFDDIHVDYDNPSPLERSPEIESANSEIDDIFASMHNS